MSDQMSSQQGQATGMLYELRKSETKTTIVANDRRRVKQT
jgi:hypothetical protein